MLYDPTKLKMCSKCGFVGSAELFTMNGNVCKKCISEYTKKRYEHKKTSGDPTEIKTCSKCGFIGESVLFKKNETLCKKCLSEYNKKWRENKKKSYDPTEIKTCSKCGFVGEIELFKKNGNVCKKCANEEGKKYRKKHPDKMKEWREHNSEKIKKTSKMWYNNHRPREIKRMKKWRELNPDKSKEYYARRRHNHADDDIERHKKYREEHPEKEREWLETPNGKESRARTRSKRRKLGHIPINNWFKGSEAHHLRYSRTVDKQDNDITIYVPRKLHQSIYHNGNTGKNMKETNIACLEWYFANTPEEERNPKAVKLYWNYCTLPEPDWSSNLNT